MLSAVSSEAGNPEPKPSISLEDKPTQGANVVSVSLRLAHSITFGSVCELGNYTPGEDEAEGGVRLPTPSATVGDWDCAWAGRTVGRAVLEELCANA